MDIQHSNEMKNDVMGDENGNEMSE